MQANIQFDNILLTRSWEEAKAYAEKTWRPKQAAELELEAAASVVSVSRAQPGALADEDRRYAER